MAKTGEILAKKVTFWEFLLSFRKKGRKPTAEALEESASVRALKKHINTILEVSNTQEAMIKELSKRVSIADRRNTEEKLIDGAISLFTQQKKGAEKPTPPLTQYERLTDDEINILLDNVGENIIQKLPKYPEEMIQAAVKNQGMSITRETAKRAKELAAQRVAI